MLRTPGIATSRAADRVLEAAIHVPFVRTRLPWLMGCLLAAGWAAGFLSSRFYAHRTWGLIATVGYLAAALVAVFAPRRRIARLVAVTALLGSVLVPLLVLLLGGEAQSEVHVVEQSAATLIGSGTPYLPDPQQFLDYNPYLPVM